MPRPYKNLVALADAAEESEYQRLVRRAEQELERKTRAKQPRVKERIVRERGFKNLVLDHEDLTPM